MAAYDSFPSLLDYECLLFRCDECRTKQSLLTYWNPLCPLLRMNQDSFIIPGGQNIGHNLEQLIVFLSLSRECLC
jgi:hypothetical protein